MDREAVLTVVRDALANYRYESPPPNSTIGVPWTADKIASYVEKLSGALVQPYLQRFELRETGEQVSPSYADFWVVAETDNYLEWYDPTTNEFGLGERVDGSDTPISIGVRGDLVGVFCAI